MKLIFAIYGNGGDDFPEGDCEGREGLVADVRFSIKSETPYHWFVVERAFGYGQGLRYAPGRTLRALPKARM
jgi:hypothetical protein